MIKKEFAALYQKKAELSSRVEAERLVSAFLETLEDVLVSGEEFAVVGFGKFEVIERAERMGRNPLTGEEIKITAKKGIKFKAGKLLVDKVNAPKGKKKK